MKNNRLLITILLGIVFVLLCGSIFLLKETFTESGNNTGRGEQENDNKEYTVVGFSQLGAESDWRSANSESMRSIFTEENGYKLIFEDAQQKQTNQITAIRSFIQQEVDYIVLAPVTESGWETVLGEAKDADIPVVIIDRMVDVADSNLFTAWIGSDFELEGAKVCEWINQYTKAIGFDSSRINIVDIQGTLGSSAQLGRTRSFDKAAEKYGWNIVAYRMGDFTQTKGKEAMLSILRSYDDVNVVYCENDNEALGVLEALEECGKTAGSDIKHGEVMVVSFDGVNQDALENLKNGKISCIGECNPLSGPRVKSVIDRIKVNEQIDKYEYLDECLYSSVDTVKSICIDGMTVDVTIVNE